MQRRRWMARLLIAVVATLVVAALLARRLSVGI
jgi:hypothetical protein